MGAAQRAPGLGRPLYGTCGIELAGWRARRDNTGIMRLLTAADSGKEMSLGVGETFEIDLAENPTAGYRWRLDASPAAVLENVSDSFEAGKKPGEEGMHHWILRAADAGSGKIAGRYQRSWATDDAPARTFSVRVHVAA
jgi:inhibitor of cysteine peptidase